jgi:hypothetical protein
VKIAAAQGAIGAAIGSAQTIMQKTINAMLPQYYLP